MKLYLASFVESENFGTGRIIGIVNGDKPSNIKCDFQFPHLTPAPGLIETYDEMRVSDPKNASKDFVKAFSDQLENFYNEVVKMAEEGGKDPKDILPFKDGDTLASWERGDYTNYRAMVAPILEKLGYEVVTN